MFATILKRFIALVFASVCVFFTKAQQIHFIYLQTETGQPFYVKLNNKVMSSSQAGYLILPKLSDGEYNVKVGFPRNEFPEENFKISIDKKNEGFLLKNFNDKGWGLFNIESFNVVMGGNTASPATTAKNLQDDPFSKMLANVVKDSTILQKNEFENEKPVIAKVDSPAIVPASPLLSSVKRLLSKKDSDGMEMVYVDQNNNTNDTIRIFIPVETVSLNKDSQNNIVQIKKPVIDSAKDSTKNLTPVLNSNPVNIDTTAAITSGVDSSKNKIADNSDTFLVNKIKDEKPFTENSDRLKTQKKKPANSQSDIVILPKVVTSSNINSDCKAFANDEDFLKLRKKMASENSDDNMIKAAKKAFNSKCFSTEQIKNLSFLFLTDKGKYVFFDAAYAHASDSDQYSTLQSQLTDSYYVNRFKAMIHK